MEIFDELLKEIQKVFRAEMSQIANAKQKSENDEVKHDLEVCHKQTERLNYQIFLAVERVKKQNGKRTDYALCRLENDEREAERIENG